MTDGNNNLMTETLGKVFAIKADNAITEYAAGEVPDSVVGFSSEAELAALSADWPARTLIDIWNRLPGVTAVSKFTNRNTAVRRIWAAITRKEHARVGLAVQRTPPRKTARKAKQPEKPHVGTKRERIIALLKRPDGATLKTIMAATGWQAHSVRGFISAQVTKKMGLKVKSFERDGERVYRIRS